MNWGEMKPAEAFEALKTAPKMAGPWRAYGPFFERIAERRDPQGRIVAWELSIMVCVHWWALADDARVNRFDTRAGADNALSRAGWILVD